MKLRVVIFYSAKKIIHTDFRRQFFTNLTFKGFFRSLSWFHLPSGKLPPVFPFPIPSLSGKYLIVLADNRCYNFYCLHNAYADSTYHFLSPNSNFNCLSKSLIISRS